MSVDDVITVLPEVVVTATACLILLADAVVDRAIARIWMPILAVLGLLVAIFSGPLTVASHTAFGGFVVVDTFTTFFRVLFCILAIFAVVVAPEYLERRAIPAAEFYATILFSTVGAMTIALASDLITVFIGLELMTIPIYVLAGMARRSRYSGATTVAKIARMQNSTRKNVVKVSMTTKPPKAVWLATVSGPVKIATRSPTTVRIGSQTRASFRSMTASASRTSNAVAVTATSGRTVATSSNVISGPPATRPPRSRGSAARTAR